MATTIDVSCPSCGNASKAPAELVGKKIRCKKCQHIFEIKAAAPKSATAKAPTPATKAKPADDEEDGPSKNPYGVVSENLSARCPFCAMAMDPPDARVCLHCGYDMVKRRRIEQKTTFERTGGDFLMYHLVTFGCFLVLIFSIVNFTLVLIYRHEFIRDSIFDNGDGTYMIKPGIVPLYVFLANMLWVVPCTRIMFKRLINFKPPEVEKKKKGED